MWVNKADNKLLVTVAGGDGLDIAAQYQLPAQHKRLRTDRGGIVGWFLHSCVGGLCRLSIGGGLRNRTCLQKNEGQTGEDE
jgi:hypothetical protein